MVTMSAFLRYTIYLLMYLNMVESQHKILYPFDISGLHYEEITEHPNCTNLIKDDNGNVDDSNTNNNNDQGANLPITTDETSPPVYCITFLKNAPRRNKRSSSKLNKNDNLKNEKSILVRRITRNTEENDNVYDKDYFLQKLPSSTTMDNFNKFLNKRETLKQNWAYNIDTNDENVYDKENDKQVHVLRKDVTSGNNVRRNVIKGTNNNDGEEIKNILITNVPQHPFLRNIPEYFALRNKQVIDSNVQQTALKTHENQEAQRKVAEYIKVVHLKRVLDNFENVQPLQYERDTERNTAHKKQEVNWSWIETDGSFLNRQQQNPWLRNQDDIKIEEQRNLNREQHMISEQQQRNLHEEQKQKILHEQQQRTLREEQRILQKQKQHNLHVDRQRVHTLEPQEPVLVHIQNKDFVSYEIRLPEEIVPKRKNEPDAMIIPNRRNQFIKNEPIVTTKSPIPPPNNQHKQTRIGDAVKGQYSYRDETHLHIVHYEAGIGGFKIVNEKIVPLDDQ